MSPSIVITDTPLDALVEHLEREYDLAIEKRGRFSIALPGGSVATEGFPKLVASKIDWARVDLLWGDERAVPPTDKDSNYLAAAPLVKLASPTNVHRMPADRDDLEAAARDYEDVVRRVGIDVALLGVGPDGHVCSLFPGHRLLDEETRWVVPIEDSPKPPPKRLTLSLPALAAARVVIAIAWGASKAKVIREAIEDASSQLPLALALRSAKRGVLITDVRAS